MPSKWKRLSPEVRWSVIGLGLLLVWLLSGMLWHTPLDDEADNRAERPQVEARMVEEAPYRRTVKISGHTEAEDRAEIAAQTAGRVQEVPVVRGDSIKKGGILVQLDPADRLIRLRAAQAELASTRKLLNAAQELTKEGYMAASVLAEREANFQAAQERVATAELDLAYARITAPFDGVVEDLHVTEGDFVSVGTMAVVLVNRDNILLVGNVAQQDRHLIVPGVTVSATLVNGQSVPAELRSVATDADTATRTYRVEARIETSDAPVPTGMAADLLIPGETTRAARIAHDWMVLGDEGSLAVVEVMQENGQAIAHLRPVTILSDTPQGVWVAGLGEGMHMLVTRGQAALKDGTAVDATLVEEGVNG